MNNVIIEAENLTASDNFLVSVLVFLLGVCTIGVAFAFSLFHMYL